MSFSSGESVSFSLAMEELGAVRLADRFGTLVKGLEIEIRIPAEAESFMDGLACLVYGSLQTDPSKEIHYYRGTQMGYASLPVRGRLYIRIPIGGGTSSQASPGTVVFDGLENTDSFPLLITILPFMKGIPDDLYNISFPVKVYPLLKDLGLLELDIRDPEGNLSEAPRIFIDDTSIDYPVEPSTLVSGLHTLRLEASGYLPVERTFSIEKGGITRVSLVLEKDVPMALFEAPEGSLVFLDGKQLQPPFNNTLEISTGEHTVLYAIGDYTISRKFFAEPGRTYKIALFLDILIENY